MVAGKWYIYAKGQYSSKNKHKTYLYKPLIHISFFITTPLELEVNLIAFKINTSVFLYTGFVKIND